MKRISDANWLMVPTVRNLTISTAVVSVARRPFGSDLIVLPQPLLEPATNRVKSWIRNRLMRWTFLHLQSALIAWMASYGLSSELRYEFISTPFPTFFPPSPRGRNKGFFPVQRAQLNNQAAQAVPDNASPAPSSSSSPAIFSRTVTSIDAPPPSLDNAEPAPSLSNNNSNTSLLNGRSIQVMAIPGVSIEDVYDRFHGRFIELENALEQTTEAVEQWVWERGGYGTFWFSTIEPELQFHSPPMLGTRVASLSYRIATCTKQCLRQLLRLKDMLNQLVETEDLQMILRRFQTHELTETAGKIGRSGELPSALKTMRAELDRIKDAAFVADGATADAADCQTAIPQLEQALSLLTDGDALTIRYFPEICGCGEAIHDRLKREYEQLLLRTYRREAPQPWQDALDAVGNLSNSLDKIVAKGRQDESRLASCLIALHEQAEGIRMTIPALQAEWGSDLIPSQDISADGLPSDRLSEERPDRLSDAIRLLLSVSEAKINKLLLELAPGSNAPTAQRTMQRATTEAEQNVLLKAVTSPLSSGRFSVAGKAQPLWVTYGYLCRISSDFALARQRVEADSALPR
jgi:hypothetical protein